MSMRFAVVYEAEADFTTATELADRVLVREIEWLDNSLLVSQREWLDKSQDGAPFKWKTIPQKARECGIRVRGHFDGEPGLADAKAARRAIEYVMYQHESVDALLLVRDLDDQNERRDGLEQARHESKIACPLVIGAAVPERESWVICGFDPEDDSEIERLQSERQNLGFDPRDRSHELTACKDSNAKRSPKRVLAVLTDGDIERQQRCWRESNIEVLEQRGQENGLRDYLDEVKSTLVPMISGHLPA